MHVPFLVRFEAHAQEADEESEEGMTRAEAEAALIAGDFEPIFDALEKAERIVEAANRVLDKWRAGAIQCVRGDGDLAMDSLLGVSMEGGN